MFTTNLISEKNYIYIYEIEEKKNLNLGSLQCSDSACIFSQKSYTSQFIIKRQ